MASDVMGSESSNGSDKESLIPQSKATNNPQSANESFEPQECSDRERCQLAVVDSFLSILSDDPGTRNIKHSILEVRSSMEKMHKTIIQGFRDMNEVNVTKILQKLEFIQKEQTGQKVGVQSLSLHAIRQEQLTFDLCDRIVAEMCKRLRIPNPPIA